MLFLCTSSCAQRHPREAIEVLRKLGPSTAGRATCLGVSFFFDIELEDLGGPGDSNESATKPENDTQGGHKDWMIPTARRRKRQAYKWAKCGDDDDDDDAQTGKVSMLCRKESKMLNVNMNWMLHVDQLAEQQTSLLATQSRKQGLTPSVDHCVDHCWFELPRPALIET